MIYKEFQNLKLSALGFGTMRLPRIGEASDAPIDEERTAEMVEYALSHGVNYFDTAYGYHEGKSEIVIGRVLSKYPRDSYYLATKFPGFDADKMSRVEEIFEEQLKKCGKDYFDFYLFHNVCEKNIDGYLDEKNGILEYLLKQKENGRIRHLGFSTHGLIPTMKRFLDAYGEHMEFCQIQLNYLDWKMQDAKGKVELLNEYHIPIWVMEPVRGGRLAKLEECYESRLKELRPQEDIPAWAFRFLQGVPGVTMILSGMSNMDQMKANIETFGEEKPLTQDEAKVLDEVTNTMLNILPCTACRYCVEKCPQELDIPGLLALYNKLNLEEGEAAKAAVGAMPEEKQPSSCIACRSCEAVCPQNIRIPDAMADFVKKLHA